MALTAREMLNGDHKVEPLTPIIPPSSFSTGLYPLITGTLDITGEVELDGEKNKHCDTQGGKGPHIHMD